MRIGIPVLFVNFKGIVWVKPISQTLAQILYIRMIALGFEACKTDAGIYEGEREPVYVLVYVDDLLINIKGPSLIERFKQLLR